MSRKYAIDSKYYENWVASESLKCRKWRLGFQPPSPNKITFSTIAGIYKWTGNIGKGATLNIFINRYKTLYFCNVSNSACYIGKMHREW